MKLHGVLVFVFGVVALAGKVSSLCLVRNTQRPQVYWYQCFAPDDYLVDLKRAPIDMKRLSFTNSKIKVIRNQSFTRLGKYLERLAIFHCDVEEIEDHAFQGLIKLDFLVVAGNKLRIIKSAWFEGLSSLTAVSFRDNRIKHIEDNFFAILPPLESMDISMNEITCLPTASFGHFKTGHFYFRHNRLTWMCLVELINWSNDRKIQYVDPDLDEVDTHYDLAKMCMEKLPKSQLSEERMSQCAEKVTREFLPTKGNYTVKQVCEFLENTPSPFLNCTK